MLHWNWKKCLTALLLAALLPCICVGLAETPDCGDGHHQWDYRKEVKATCTQNGSHEKFCSVCGKVAGVEPIGAIGHQMGEWETVTTPNCISEGTKVIKCLVCGAVLENVAVPKGGHAPGEWTVEKAAACTEKGLRVKKCTVCGIMIEREDLSAPGHSFGAWTVIKPVACTENGLEERACAVCGLKENRYLPAPGHQFTPWQTVKPVSCEENGLRERTCPVCGLLESEYLPATGHQHTHWTITVQPTLTATGERKLTCDDCGKLLKTEVMSVVVMNNNTLCAMGPRLRDVTLAPNPDTDLWYMFTPFDASIEGKQTFDLVASNLYVVGDVTLNISDGMLTLNYRLNSDQMDVTLEFFTVLPSMGVLSQYTPEALYSQYALRAGEPIDLKEAFGDDTRLVLYFCSRADYRYDQKRMMKLDYDAAPNRALIDSMLALMD